MRYINIIAVLFLFSCSSENKLHLSNVELLEVIMTEHDDLMLEMKSIKEIKNNLLELDEIEEDSEVVKNLDDARMSMMNFMKDFSNEFSFDKYPMDKNTYDNLEGIDINDVNLKLNKYKSNIDLVSEKFKSSISSGKEILDAIE
tara:strand:+ start:98 stop:529 length:432 start_codon:yes stop_codon:yes gene_type:complete